MSSPLDVNPAGRRRSPATMPGYHAGRPSRATALKSPPVAGADGAAVVEERKRAVAIEPSVVWHVRLMRYGGGSD